MKRIKNIAKWFIGSFLIFLCFTLGAYFHVKSVSKDALYEEVNQIPFNNVGVLLGTSKYSVKGGLNLYFTYRMEAAIALYKAKKIKKIIVSGDNHIEGYNEPEQMKQYLVNKGIPSENIILDYAGFRTFDSMVRANKIFSQNSFTIISQKFHNERAVFISKAMGYKVVGFNAKTPYYSYRMRFREFLAKTKAVLDIYVLKTKPKFLGKKIEIDG